MSIQKIVLIYNKYTENSAQVVTVQRRVTKLWLTRQQCLSCPCSFQNSHAKSLIHEELKTINLNWECVFIFSETSWLAASFHVKGNIYCLQRYFTALKFRLWLLQTSPGKLQAVLKGVLTARGEIDGWPAIFKTADFLLRSALAHQKDKIKIQGLGERGCWRTKHVSIRDL